MELFGAGFSPITARAGIYGLERGDKRYALSNHLGNVLAVVSDRRAKASCADTLVRGYWADVMSTTDYYPFGMGMVERGDDGSYRYGFNGMQRDDEWQGAGNAYDFGARMYDGRLGRWMSVDPIIKENQSSYWVMANNPIWILDSDGRDTLVMHRSPILENYIDGKTNVYLVTFSIIRNGVEKALPIEMYMISNKRADKFGSNSLPLPIYKLEFDLMSMHQNDPDFSNTIRVTKFGVFIHPGNIYTAFGGCLGLSESPPELVSSSKNSGAYWINNTVEALEKVRQIYDDVDGNGGSLTGDKFLLRTNSQVRQKLEPVEITQEQPIYFNQSIDGNLTNDKGNIEDSYND